MLYTANIHPRFPSTFSSCGWFKEFNLKKTHSLQLFITSAYWFSVLNYFSQAFRYECTIYCSFIASFILKLKFDFVTTWFTLYTAHIFIPFEINNNFFNKLSSPQFFVRLDHIRKCFTKNGVFILEEFSKYWKWY